jgi:hypothetical protein
VRSGQKITTVEKNQTARDLREISSRRIGGALKNLHSAMQSKKKIEDLSSLF